MQWERRGGTQKIAGVKHDYVFVLRTSLDRQEGAQMEQERNTLMPRRVE